MSRTPTETIPYPGLLPFRISGVATLASACLYIGWRLLGSTIDWQSAWISVPFVVSEAAVALNILLIVFIGWRRVVRRSPGMAALSSAVPESAWPTVDVLITMMNEPIELIETTLNAAVRLDYPEGKLRVLLLDDAGRPEAKQRVDACSGMGHACVYVTRVRPGFAPRGAKAGNLNHGLRCGASRGELVLLLDSDQVPSRHAIHALLPHFFAEAADGSIHSRTRIAFVQSPDCSWSLRAGNPLADDTRTYYEAHQQSGDAWNAVGLTGTSCLLRRQALDEIGGFDENTVTEDFVTGVLLCARGWEGRYHSEVVVKGVPPVDFPSMIRQRLRWLEGNLQALRVIPLREIRRLTLPQKLVLIGMPLQIILRALSAAIFLLTPIGVLLGARFFRTGPRELAGFFLPYFIFMKLQLFLFYRGVPGRALYYNERVAALTVPVALIALFRVAFLGSRIHFWVSPKPGERRLGSLGALLAQAITFGSTALFCASFLKCASHAIVSPTWLEARLWILGAAWQAHFLICAWPAVWFTLKKPRNGHDLDLMPRGEPVRSPLRPWRSTLSYLWRPVNIAPVITIAFHIGNLIG